MLDMTLSNFLLSLVLPSILGSLCGGLTVYLIGASRLRSKPREFLVRQAFYIIASPPIAFFLFEAREPRTAFLVGIVMPLVAQQFSKLASKGFETERVVKLKETITKAEAEVEKQPEKSKPLWDLSRASFELYLTRNLSQVRQIFWITIVVMTAGFGMVVYGVYRAFDNQIQVAVLTAASGVITQAIGVTFLLIYRSTMKQATDYVATLERINAVGMAVSVLDQIPDDSKDAKIKARIEVVKHILVAPLRRGVGKDE